MPESLSHITTESQWRGLMLTSRREILACLHVEENGRREEYGALSGSLWHKARTVVSLGVSISRTLTNSKLINLYPFHGKDISHNRLG